MCIMTLVIRCIQKNPLFPFNPETNPILCEGNPKPSSPLLKIVLGAAGALVLGILVYRYSKRDNGVKSLKAE